MTGDAAAETGRSTLPVALVGDDVLVPCAGGLERRYVNLDAAASTSALPAVAQRVHEFVPWYSSVHRGAGYKSRHATQLYEHSRAAALDFAGRHHDGDDVGAGILLGPRRSFTEGDPFLAGGGAVDLVDLDEVTWTDPPEREEAGSPNVVGAVALHAAIDELNRIGWDAIVAHNRELSTRLRSGLAAIPGVTVLGPDLTVDTLPVAAFTIAGLHHALVAARLSVEHGVGVRHGCFCAHPYLLRLLDLTPRQVADYHAAVLAGDRLSPGRSGASTWALGFRGGSAAERQVARRGRPRSRPLRPRGGPEIPHRSDPRTYLRARLRLLRGTLRSARAALVGRSGDEGLTTRATH